MLPRPVGRCRSRRAARCSVRVRAIPIRDDSDSLSGYRPEPGDDRARALEQRLELQRTQPAPIIGVVPEPTYLEVALESEPLGAGKVLAATRSERVVRTVFAHGPRHAIAVGKRNLLHCPSIHHRMCSRRSPASPPPRGSKQVVRRPRPAPSPLIRPSAGATPAQAHGTCRWRRAVPTSSRRAAYKAEDARCALLDYISLHARRWRRLDRGLSA